jgi:N-acetyl sugar amidotransferase
MTVGNYQLCTRCVMDSSAANIQFDELGVCSFCTEFLSRSGEMLSAPAQEKAKQLAAFVETVKRRGEGKPYDCVVGVSGGVDSSWVLVKVVELGLRPLAVHMDNGWNTELAQNNIANLVRGLGVDLYTHVIEWGEYKTLMQAFFDADVLDVELLYDNAMLAVNYELATKHGLKYILSGSNQATEGMAMPAGWNWFKFDKKNIKSLAKRFSGIRLKTFPAFGTLDYIWTGFVRGVKWVPVLDMMDYNKNDALEVLTDQYGYKPYPYKHYESIFTRFYQGYILPRKFGVDKRRLHLSTLIMSGQLDRQAALAGVAGLPYPSEAELNADIQYFLKKMGWTAEQLETYLARPEVAHDEYGSEKKLWNFCIDFYRRFFAG